MTSAVSFWAARKLENRVKAFQFLGRHSFLKRCLVTQLMASGIFSSLVLLEIPSRDPDSLRFAVSASIEFSSNMLLYDGLSADC